jgi:hypothetical protein
MDNVGNLLWTGSTNGSGNYSGTVGISATTSTIVTAMPTSSTQQATSTTGTLTAGVTHAYGTINLQPAAGYTCALLCGTPLKQTLTLTSPASCAGNTFPNDTLTYQSSPPAWATSLVSGGGWLGSMLFTIATVDPTHPNSYVYWLQRDGTLSALRQNPTPVARTLANPSATLTCGTTFSTTYHCGLGSSINATISA